jgi:valyl-tRNA synthetase
MALISKESYWGFVYMKIELAKTYEVNLWEEKIYKTWEDSGLFIYENCISAGQTNEQAAKFSLLMPPPNVTGVLHLGHAFEGALMDVQARYHRLLGEQMLFIPGTDHAAVATQAKVEKLLCAGEINGQKKHVNPRQELGRDRLLAIIKDYATSSKQTIIKQIKRLGISCDWSRLAYTLDDARSTVVYDLFEKMFSDSLIYRGYRAINWSIAGQSTCSDDELEYKTEKTKLYTLRYSADFPIAIATTRPETKLGDTAVAVNPHDKRYQQYLGQKYQVNFCGVDLTINIIADEQVDSQFGTGAVGVTPAHSQIDYDIYNKNKDIGLIQVIGQDGRMTNSAGIYAYQKVEDCRQAIINKLKESGLIEKEEEIEHNVACSDRFGDAIEVLPMEQWFVDVNKEVPGRNKSLKQLMIDAVTVGHNNNTKKIVKIMPARFKDSYLNWLANLRDWCISRQVWWGHRIPVWYKDGNMKVGQTSPGDDWQQDPDTLDTWFSSGAWSFSTLVGNNDFEKFHPISWMQMGYEILFFWLARMILMTTYYKNDIPFEQVYIHGILRDSDGKKFSKSLGNGINPVELADKYGADAVRLALLANVAAGNDSRFYLEKVEHYRNFINKLWNISRYILLQTNAFEQPLEPIIKTDADGWLLTRLNQVIQTVDKQFDKFDFSGSINTLYDFTWLDFADWYLEIAKIEGQKLPLLSYVLSKLLVLWHPFAPYVTEVIYQQINNNQSLLITQPWPKPDNVIKLDMVKEIEEIKEIVSAIRTEKNLKQIPFKQVLSVGLMADIKLDNLVILEKLAQVKVVKEFVSEQRLVVKDAVVYFDQAELILVKNDNQPTVERLNNYIKQLKARLDDKEFLNKAPIKVLDETKAKLARAEKQLAEIEK